jgi:protoporphyrinogen oxidase
MSATCPVVILGGGLAGLAAAGHLRPVPSLVIEAEAEVGGLARSHAEDGFVFDCTGHLLHLRDARIQALVDRLLPGTLARHERRAQIFSHGVFTAYPFQANLHGLPQEVVLECLTGFVESLLRRPADGDPDPAQASFKEWAGRTFGAGIARHFMLPYNAKLWRVDLEEVECGWVSWSVPRPQLKEVLEGAFGRTVRGLGYNPTFLYPRRGGIRALPDALAGECPEIRTRRRAVAVDARARTVTLDDGAVIGWETLVSTIPLDRLLAITRGLPEALPAAGRGLRAVRVLNISLGIDRAAVCGAHWIYFPEPAFSIYRAGFPGNLSDTLAPRGCSPIYAERSLLRDEPFDPDAVVAQAVEDLRRAGILRAGDRIVHRRVQVLDPAYVIYDRHRAAHLPGIHAGLKDLDIVSTGRFGAWEYSSMETAIQEGMDAAESIRPRFLSRQAARRAV